MQTFRIETTITPDGKIVLPNDMKDIFNHKVDLVLREKDTATRKRKLNIPVLHCGGKVADFSREELYESRF
jgi:hypothetical protein